MEEGAVFGLGVGGREGGRMAIRGGKEEEEEEVVISMSAEAMSQGQTKEQLV